jgi:glycosyltransferase involved in cell wall biosynthesis
MARILFLSHYALPHLGGIEVVVDSLACEMAQAGHDVVHVASDSLRQGEHGCVTAPTTYQLIRVSAANILETQAGVPWPLFSPRLLSVVRREIGRADVIHGHGLLYLSSALGILAARRTQAVRVLTEHVGHVHYENPILNFVEAVAIATLGRAVAQAAEAIVVLNTKVWNEMVALAPSARLALIPNGVDIARYRLPAPGERTRLRHDLGWDDTPRILFVGRLVRKKGINLAVDAVARLGGRARLVVVGPGKLQAAPHVEILGPLPPARIAELYRAADVFFLPSRGEGFPLTAQEAMSSGLPVVLAEDPTYAPYLVEDGSRMAAADPAALARAITPLLDPSTRVRAGEAAARKARADFSRRASAEAHLRLYDEVRAARP